MIERVSHSNFFKVCVLKLGLTYILLAVVAYTFLNFKLSYGFWWMHSVVFALSDKIAFVLFTLMVILFLYGFYSWLRAFRLFVFANDINTNSKFFSAGYLILAPILAAMITSELYQILLIDPFQGYKP